ncbi:MAG: sulfotransferase [Desulfobacterales bacterium]|nr:sulfotransferase [Desulfobacterales bacterium]
MPVPYIYICSAGHSGSTLLDLLLGSHTNIASLGEITQLPKNIALNTTCTCGEPILKCRLWRKIVDEISEEEGNNLIENPYKFNLGHIKAVVVKDKNHQTQFYNVKMKLMGLLLYAKLNWSNFIPQSLFSGVDSSVENTFRIYNKVRKELSVTTIVDSSKTYLKAVSLYLSRPEDVRIILLTKDARGVIYSGVKRKRNAKKTAKSWARHYSRAITLFKRNINKNGYLHVRYEDLVKDPHQTLKKVCHYINIDFEDTMLDFLKKTHHITNGNNMRFLDNSTIKNDESWIKGLSKKDLKEYESFAMKINRTFGY